MEYSDILGKYNPCERCGKEDSEKYRQNTFYENEDDNWVTLCEYCRKENDEYWEEMWREYYSGCM
jgi:hypothetical protein